MSGGTDDNQLERVRLTTPGDAMAFTGERFVPGMGGDIELEHVHRYLFAAGICEGQDVLDIASGEGFGSAMLGGVARSVLGVDIDSESVAHAAKSYGGDTVRYETGSCTQIPAEDDAFDVVVSFETIEHIEEQAQFLREVRRVLRPGGVFVCSTPDKDIYDSGPDGNAFHLRELTRDGFAALLDGHFTNSEVFGQRLVGGSAIVRREGSGVRLVSTRDGKSFESTAGDAGATYLVAVCSDQPLGGLEGSLFDDKRYRAGVIAEAAENLWHARMLKAERARVVSDLEEIRELGRSVLGAQSEGAAEVEQFARDARVMLDAADREGLGAELGVEVVRAALAGSLYERRVLLEQREAYREALHSAKATLVSLKGELGEAHAVSEERAFALEEQRARVEEHKQALEERGRALEEQEELIRCVRASLDHARNLLRRGWTELENEQRRSARAERLLGNRARGAEAAARRSRGELGWIKETRTWRWTGWMRAMGSGIGRIRMRGLGLLARIAGAVRPAWGETLRIRRRAALYRTSSLFDASWYLRKYSDVAASRVDPAWHLAARGLDEVRSPSELFDAPWYLAQNEDVREQGLHPFEHYLTTGEEEGRSALPAIPIPAADRVPPAAPVTEEPVRVVVREPAAIPEVSVDSDRLAKTKVLAFYLPQYHPIPENDAWWGKGFTEWQNVTRAKPMYDGHVQPVLPGELGFYDLRLPEVRERQAELARAAGIHGFCYHHYWFNGKRLLERPLDEVLKTGRPDLPFCVCWANENWTRRWDGKAQHVLMRQEHSLSEDRRFIRDLLPYMEDERYVRVDGKPVVVVYRAGLMVNAADTAAVWRDECVRAGLGDIHLCAVMMDTSDPRPLGFDAAVEFPLHHFPAVEMTHRVSGLGDGFSGVIQDYEAGALEMIRKPRNPDYRLYRGVMPSWDNTARRMGKGSTVFDGATPELYEAWLKSAVNQRHPDERPDGENLVFVNAWNEWAEGAVLEPRRDLGDAYLRATARALGVQAQYEREEGADDAEHRHDGGLQRMLDDEVGEAGGEAAGTLETKLKRVVRSNAALNSFVNRHPELKSKAAGLVKKLGERSKGESNAVVGTMNGACAVRWRGKASKDGGAKLLVVSHDAALAGAQLIVLENIRHWVRRGIDCRVLLLGSGVLEPEFSAQCPTACVEDLAGMPRARAIGIILDQLAQDGWKPDAGFCNTVASVDAVDALRDRGVKVVCAVYELPTSIDDALGGRRTIERVMRGSERVMVASGFVRDRLSAAYGISDDRLEAVHTGVLSRGFPQRDEARTAIRKKLGVGADAFVVLGCGSVHHRKGTDLFVGVAGELAGWTGREVVFAWVGEDQAGATFGNWCRHDAERLGVGDRVRFLGRQDDPGAWFAGSDVFALTSREDPFPMVNLEALSAGLPVVAFAGGGGAPEALIDRRGIVVPYADVRAMGAAIRGMGEDQSMLDGYRERSSAFAREGLGWERYMDEIEEMLASCSEQFGAAAVVGG